MMDSGVIDVKNLKNSKVALVYGQMNEPPGARARVALTGLTQAEYFRDKEGRDVVDELVRDAAAAGATIILSSHELDRAIDLADEIVTLGGGVALDDSGAGGDGHVA